jgi:hypothetical protein
MQGMKIALAALLLLTLVPARAEDTVVMVTIDGFAQASRERAINEARFAALTGTMELYADVGLDEAGVPARLTAKGRVNQIREKVIRKMGIVPRAYFPFGGCIPRPAGEAYALAYHDASEAYFRNKLGADFRAKIEAEVLRLVEASRLHKR